MTVAVDKIRSRGHWRVLVRPQRFERMRVANILELMDIVRSCAVRFRGWDFPYVKLNDVVIGDEWIQQETDWNHYVELWRIYQSGQFVYWGGIAADWRDQSDIWPPDKRWKAGVLLGIGDTIFRFQESFEFASRLSCSPPGLRSCISR